MTRHELKRQGIAIVEYHAGSLLMRIQFARGPVYEYEQVPQGIVDWLLRTKDPAGYLKRVITPGFAYRRVDGPMPTLASGVALGTSDDELEAMLRASINKLGGPAS